MKDLAGAHIMLSLAILAMVACIYVKVSRPLTAIERCGSKVVELGAPLWPAMGLILIGEAPKG